MSLVGKKAPRFEQAAVVNGHEIVNGYSLDLVNNILQGSVLQTE